jgi:hypothetical protein
MTGVSNDTASATATFVMRHGKPYTCTCRHVAEQVFDGKKVPRSKFPTLALKVGGRPLNLSRMTRNKAELTFRSPKDKEIDIAIAPLCEGYWKLLTDEKNKSAINLDSWRAPDWSSVKWGLAAGYPDEHKTLMTVDNKEHIANQLITAVAEVSSPLPPQKFITLSSELAKSHSWYFSGLSGGPLYVVEGPEERDVEDDALFPVGIVFQGFPSTGRPDVPGAQQRDPNEAFLNNRDLFFRALALTPDTFDEWLHTSVPTI